jgi:hypothetical protein
MKRQLLQFDQLLKYQHLRSDLLDQLITEVSLSLLLFVDDLEEETLELITSLISSSFSVAKS